jgi:GNAT superfamily N-acetyltransferase
VKEGFVAITVDSLCGADIAPVVPALSKLRLTVFREWPYLYDGDAAYEADYLATFAAHPDSVVVAARDGADLVGAATAAPLAGHTNEFVPLFKAYGYKPARIFYCGESVLLPAYRGRGLGRAFFDHREAHARALNARGHRFTHSTFCGVIREADDPRKPADYRPLDPFWRKRGYAPVPGLIGTYDWREIGASAETTKQMQFWIGAL